MRVREFASPDGRRWRVWAVQAGAVVRAVGIGVVGERRRRDRRRTAGEAPPDPRAFLRRRFERRVAAATARRAPEDALPAPWCEGWLVFQSEPDGPGGVRETRRLAPIPACWDGCSDADLARHLDEASRDAARGAGRGERD